MKEQIEKLENDILCCLRYVLASFCYEEGISCIKDDKLCFVAELAKRYDPDYFCEELFNEDDKTYIFCHFDADLVAKSLLADYTNNLIERAIINPINDQS